MRLRHLLWRSVPCDSQPSTVKITAPERTQHVNEMLGIASQFPRMIADGSLADDSNAQRWLLQECNRDRLKKLSQLQSMEPPANDAGGVTKCVSPHLQWFVSCC
jgi:hypothetical protein